MQELKRKIDRAEASGKYLFNYDVICENLFLTDIVQPDKVEIEQETTSDGLPQVKVTLYDIKASIQIEYLYVKYGLIKETFDNPTGSVVVSSIEGRYYFTKEGKLVLSEFNVEIDSFDIDVRKDFLNWLIGLFKGLIKSQVTKALNDLGSTISDGVNDWVDGEFSLDIGYGIGLNLTNTLKPQLTQILKFQKLNEIGLNFAKAIFSKEILEETLTSVLTFGVVGSAYPSDRPDYVPDLPPPAAMDFTTEYFSNELQILLSTIKLNHKITINDENENNEALEINMNDSFNINNPVPFLPQLKYNIKRGIFSLWRNKGYSFLELLIGLFTLYIYVFVYYTALGNESQQILSLTDLLEVNDIFICKGNKKFFKDSYLNDKICSVKLKTVGDTDIKEDFIEEIYQKALGNIGKSGICVTNLDSDDNDYEVYNTEIPMSIPGYIMANSMLTVSAFS